MATEKKAPFAQNVADEVKETNKLLATYIRNGLDMASTDWHKLESIAHEGTFGNGNGILRVPHGIDSRCTNFQDAILWAIEDPVGLSRATVCHQQCRLTFHGSLFS